MVEAEDKAQFELWNHTYKFCFLARDFEELFCVALSQNYWNVITEGDDDICLSQSSVGKEFDQKFALKILNRFRREKVINTRSLDISKKIHFVRVKLVSFEKRTLEAFWASGKF